MSFRRSVHLTKCTFDQTCFRLNIIGLNKCNSTKCHRSSKRTVAAIYIVSLWKYRKLIQILTVCPELNAETIRGKILKIEVAFLSDTYLILIVSIEQKIFLLKYEMPSWTLLFWTTYLFQTYIRFNFFENRVTNII